MRRMGLIAAAFAVVVSLAACGSSPDERSQGSYGLEGERGTAIGGLGGAMLGGVLR